MATRSMPVVVAGYYYEYCAGAWHSAICVLLMMASTLSMLLWHDTSFGGAANIISTREKAFIQSNILGTVTIMCGTYRLFVAFMAILNRTISSSGSFG